MGWGSRWCGWDLSRAPQAHHCVGEKGLCRSRAPCAPGVQLTWDSPLNLSGHGAGCTPAPRKPRPWQAPGAQLLRLPPARRELWPQREVPVDAGEPRGAAATRGEARLLRMRVLGEGLLSPSGFLGKYVSNRPTNRFPAPAQAWASGLLGRQPRPGPAPGSRASLHCTRSLALDLAGTTLHS